MKSLTPLSQWLFESTHAGTGTKTAEVTTNRGYCGNCSQEDKDCAGSADRQQKHDVNNCTVVSIRARTRQRTSNIKQTHEEGQAVVSCINAKKRITPVAT